MAFAFRPRRGGAGYDLDWEGDVVLEKMIEASRRGIDEISELGADTARTDHPWETRSGQTEAAIFWRRAIIETNYRGGPQVWGEWGVEDRPRFDESGDLESVTTEAVAMFLEFGTVKMAARPFLYPAWDKTKVLLPAAIARHAVELALIPNSQFRLRGAGGRFLSFGL